MLQTLKNAWKVEELRKGFLFTIMILIIYRIGAAIPIPYVDSSSLRDFMTASSQGSLFQYFNVLSGDAFARATLFALSISPYINSSIIMQLLTIAIPALERLSQQGEEGRRKIASITRYVTIALALLTAFGYYTFMRNQLWQDTTGAIRAGFLFDNGIFAAIVIIVSYVAGASIIMWLGEQINEHGIGNGISMILFANIVASLPSQFMGVFANEYIGIILAVVVILLTLATMWFVVFISNAEHRIPVQYAKRQVGRKMYGGQNSFLPIKVNMTGVMPIIFASAIVSIPSTIAMFVPAFANWPFYQNWLSQRGPIYMIIFFFLIIAFAYFYVAISFNPVEVANNLKKNSGTVIGHRPGKPTADYITRVLNRVTLIGAVALAVIAILPIALAAFNQNLASLTFSGTSVIIVVGVVIEVWREIEAKLSMRHYKGFLDR